MKAVHSAALKSLLVAGFIGFLFLVIPRTLLGIFGMTDPDAVEISIQLLRYLSVSGLFVCVALSYTGGLQGTGDTKGPLYISLISQLVLPLGYCFVVQQTRGLTPGDIWLAIVMGHVTRAGLSIARFRQGKWRDIRVRLA
jgi:Na+-driven multidrug efflux pump